MQTNDIAIIILAAGQSSRFGSSKMHHCLESGKSILNTCLEQYQKSFKNINVVLPDGDKANQIMINPVVHVVVSKHAINGMSQSIISGVESQPDASAWLIALGDMPYVRPETVLNLAIKATTNNIVVPMYGHRNGNPVIFGRNFYSQLMSLKGDVGAKKLINDNVSSVLKVPVGDQGVLLDIDRPEDIL